jgi:hypothetical protein
LTLFGSSWAASIKGRVASLNSSSVSVSRRIDGWPPLSSSWAATGCHADIASMIAIMNRRMNRESGEFIGVRLAFPGLNRR